MTKMLTPVLTEVRQLLGPPRHSTVVFDRGGRSPKLFRSLPAMGFDILTYRKGRTRRIAEARFSRHQAKLHGRAVKYLFHDQPVRFLKGKLRLRQVTHLTGSGHQTPIVTSGWDLRAIVVAYRRFERWRQENFFKYLREEYLIDALPGRVRRSHPFGPQSGTKSPGERAAHGPGHSHQAVREPGALQQNQRKSYYVRRANLDYDIGAIDAFVKTYWWKL